MSVNSVCSPLSSPWSSARSSASPACSVSACEWTETYSPAAIDIAPATSPATPATNTLLWVACAAATPSSRLDVESMPSFAPNTAARNQPMRPVRCRSLLSEGILEASLNLRWPPAHGWDYGRSDSVTILGCDQTAFPGALGPLSISQPSLDEGRRVLSSSQPYFTMQSGQSA